MITAIPSDPKRSTAGSAVRLLVKIVVTGGLLGALATKVNLSAVSDKIGAIGFVSCAICILATLALATLSAWRWQMILACMQSPVVFGESWRLVMTGLFFNQILPSGIGGDAVRVWLLSRGGTRLRTAIFSVVADRIFALGAVILCMAGFLPLLLHGPAKWPVIFLTTAGSLAVGAIFVLPRALGALTRVWPDRLYPVGGRLIDRGRDLLREFAAVLVRILSARPEGPTVIAISITNQLVLGWIVYFIAGRLHVEIGLLTAIALFTPAMLLSMLPISLGGWGVREAALVWLLGTVNVPQEASLAISVLFGVVSTAAGLVGGVLWLFERHPGAPARPSASRTAPAPAPAPAVPAVVQRSLTVLSPWVSIMARSVDFGGGRIEVYHAVDQADYIAILAVTPDLRIPIVRQYRPALERFTCELPAGMVNPGEAPARTCARELREETGLNALRIHALGRHAADSARLGNSIYSFLVETESAEVLAAPEPGIEVEFVSFARLRTLILTGEFDLQFHVATVGLALMRPEFARLLDAPASEHISPKQQLFPR